MLGNRKVFIAVAIVAVVLAGGFWVYMAIKPSADKPAAVSRDSTPPSVRFISPTSTENLTGKVVVTVSATDNSQVAKVEYYVDGVFVGVTYNSPFSFTLDTTTLSAGTHQLRAKAFDTAGNSSDTTISFTVADQTSATTPEAAGSTGGVTLISHRTRTAAVAGSTTPPDTAPPSMPTGLLLAADGIFLANVSWQAATDNVGVAGYDVYRDGTWIGSSSTTSFVDRTVVPGNTYSYAITAYDAAGNVSGVTSAASVTLAPTSIWLSSADAAASLGGSSTPAVVGNKFSPRVSGTITGVRFYKGTGNTGTHVGHLWSSTGTNLGSVTFTNETASGWQDATFATPISVTAGATYTVSYYAPNNHVSFTNGYFGTQGITTTYLTVPATGNSVVEVGSGDIFPVTADTQHVNYWVDVDFVPDRSTTGPTPRVADNSHVYSGFPGSNNTGIPAGRRLLARDRGFDYLTASAVIQDIDLSASVIEPGTATGDATIKYSKITGIIQNNGSGAVTLADSEIDGGSNNSEDIAYNNITVLRSNLYGNQHQVHCSTNCVVQDSWLHDNYNFGPSGHQNNFLSNGGSNYTIRHNTVYCVGGCTGEITFIPDANVSSAVVDNNLFLTTTYAAYCLEASSNVGKIGIVNQMTITNNIFQRGSNNLCAVYGPSYGWDTPNNNPGTNGYLNVWSNNHWDDGTILNP